MQNLDLSIIILSYNTKDITDECLRRLQLSVVSCQTNLKNDVEVIVVDNASGDGSPEMIKEKHSWVKLLEFKINTGFSKGNNLGLKEANGDFILFLNSDAYVKEDTLIKALGYFQKNSGCDVLGPGLTFENGKLQHSAGCLPDPLNTFAWIFSLSLIPPFNRISPFHPKYKEFFVKDREVGWVMGAFFMMKKEVLDKAGGFDESFFMYLEEVEFCKRIKEHGFEIWYVPEIKVIHLMGASSNFDMSSAFINELKGLRYFFNKHYKSFFGIIRIYLVLGLILRIIAFSLIGKTKRSRAYVEGLKVV